MSPMSIHKRVWGEGEPVIALHPLGLESSGFAGFGKALARRGKRTIAVDLPGFGRSPAPNAPLTPAVLAQPVIAMARAMRPRPTIVGISLGGRVALEAALTAPEAFRSVIAIAPYLPWLRYRWLFQAGYLLDPRLAGLFPLERIWPLLRLLSGALERVPQLRDDELAQAGMRLVYYFACPATRASFLSATRELALDPPLGRNGLWTRLRKLAVPAAFVWGERDGLVSVRFAARTAQVLPRSRQLRLPCLGHWLNGRHHRCLAETVACLLDDPARAGAPLRMVGSRRRRPRFETVGCLLDDAPPEAAIAPLSRRPRSSRRRRPTALRVKAIR